MTLDEIDKKLAEVLNKYNLQQDAFDILNEDREESFLKLSAIDRRKVLRILADFSQEKGQNSLLDLFEDRIKKDHKND